MIQFTPAQVFELLESGEGAAFFSHMHFRHVGERLRRGNDSLITDPVLTKNHELAVKWDKALIALRRKGLDDETAWAELFLVARELGPWWKRGPGE